MGDGGVIAQVKDTAGELIAITDGSWRCLVVHEAPLDKRCADEDNPKAGVGYWGFIELETPSDWGKAEFKETSGWLDATVYSARDVRPKDGYDLVDWDNEAKLIWGPDLESNNTLLCRIEIK